MTVTRMVCMLWAVLSHFFSFLQAGFFKRPLKKKMEKWKKKKKKSRNFCSGLPPKCYCKIINLEQWLQCFLNAGACKKPQETENQEENQACMQRDDAKKEWTTLQHFVIVKNIPLRVAHFWRVTEFKDSNIF